MANMFTPEPSTNIAFEQPVAPVQETSFMENVASTANNFLKAGVSGSKSSSGSDSMVDTSLVREFSIQMQQAQNIRDTKGDSAGALAEKKVLSSWNNKGFSLHQPAYAQVYTNVTGKEWKDVGVSFEQSVEQDLFESAEGQSLYSAAAYRLGQDASTEEIKDSARLMNQQMKAAQHVVNRKSALSNAAWVEQKGGDDLAQSYLSSVGPILSSLNAQVAKGAIVTKEEILKAQLIFNQIASVNKFKIPDGVDPKHYSKFTDMVAQTDKGLEALHSLADKSTKENDILQAGMSVIQSTTPDPVEQVVLMRVVGDAATAAQYLKGDLAETLKNLFNHAERGGEGDPVKIAPLLKTPGLDILLAGAPPGFGDRNREDTPPDPSTSPELQERVDFWKGASKSQVEGAVKIHRDLLTTNPLATQEGTQAWLKSAGDLGLLMRYNKFSALPSGVADTLINERFYTNLNKAYQSDPGATAQVVSYLKPAFEMELNKAQKPLDSLVRRMPITVEEDGRITTSLAQLTNPNLESGPATAFEAQQIMDAFNSSDLKGDLRNLKGSRWPGAASDYVRKVGNLDQVPSLLKLMLTRDEAQKRVTRLSSIVSDRYSKETKTSGLENLVDSSVVQDNPLYQPLIDMGVPASELQGVVTGESKGRTSVKNPDGSASGIFQITKDAAKDLGTTPEKIRAMSEVEQVALYGKYLKRWKYKPGIPLAIMQAAPAKAKGWDGTDEYVLYKKGSAGWKSNKDWRDELNNDDVTVGSVKAYFKRNEGQTEAGKPPITAKVGAEVVEGGVLSGVVTSVREALGLGSDEEAQSVAEKLMKSGVIPTRPEGLSVDQPMRLPPVRGEEQNNLPPSNPTLAAAQLRQQSRDQANISLNSESLSQLDPGTAESLVRLGSPIAGLVIRQLPWANAQAFGQYISKGKIDIKDVPLNDNDKTLLREKAGEALASGKNKLDYSSWGVTGKGVLVGGLVNTASKTVSDENFRMATFLGQATVRKAANGDIIISDKYDFNPGPKGDKLKEALLAREMGDAATYEKLKEEALGGASWFEATRIWAATLKINDKPAEVFEINLGQ